MRKLALIILLLLPSFAFGQGTFIFATYGTRPTDTAKTLNTLFLPKYATADSNKVLGLDARGVVVLRTKSTGGSGADSAVFSPNYRVDTAKTQIRAEIATKVPTSRTISTTYPVQGGGDLSANRTITVDTGRAVGQLITGDS